MPPIFTQDAIAFGLLIIVLALIFYTSNIKTPGWQKFYRFVPALLLCYFLPALLNWPLGLISPEYYSPDILGFLKDNGILLDSNASFVEINEAIKDDEALKKGAKSYLNKSQLYYVASRYLLPASLILLCLSIDLKGLKNLGPKSLIMFVTATLGIVIGGPIALLVTSFIAPDILGANADQIWRGLSTVAGSWIGGGANQAAMKEIYEVGDNLFGTMIVVDVVVANIWMGFLLYGASISNKIDEKWLKADNSAIEDLKNKVADYRASVERMPTTTSLFVLLAVAFGGVALAHWGMNLIAPLFESINENSKSLLDANGNQIYPNGKIVDWGLSSLMSGFFWMIVVATTVGLALSFTRAKSLEGVGASRWGSIFIYILVATIGMKMNLSEVFDNLNLFFVGIIWMLVHVIILLVVAKLIRAPFFFVAVGSQANVGGAASAPIVASAFSPSLAPVGVLMAVLGYALGTYGAIICAEIMRSVAT